ncbi:MAG: SDR family NAD(P)-dependent oxidoreductase [Anaerolineales bacterium]|nr:SDR family NAD(P)-dependent oxidoreductase [Anaerolineales bacterium]
MEAKTIVITGATSGIGLAAASALAGMGHTLVCVGRDRDRCRHARESILRQAPQADVTYLLADLSSQKQVRGLAGEIKQAITGHRGESLDVLVNNAGGVSNWYTTTEDGYELQFAVNHLAPFLLTLELLPLLQAAPGARVLTVSSGSHRNMQMHWQDIMYSRKYNTLLAYKQSKLANVLFSYEFNRRYGQDSGPRAYAIDPGLVNTSIGLKGTSGLVHWIWEQRRRGGASPEKGAETVVHVASDQGVSNVQEVYWKDCRPLPPSKYARREAEAARLWALSERLCGVG